MTENPLHKYFRIPGLNISLPTQGKFFTDGAALIAGNIPVFPMRAADELLLKNPDALMSGFAIEKLLESCVPAIKNPREISAPDLDVLLLAIRAATYGDTMEIQATCPECQTENSFDCDLGAIIQNVKPIPDENFIRLSNDLVVYVRPYNLENTTALSLATFEETRKVQAADMNDQLTTEQKSHQINVSMQRLSSLNTTLLSKCVVKIVTPEGEVSDPAFIDEFFQNITKTWTSLIEDKLLELNNAGIDKSISVKCSRVTCGHEWKTVVEFDPANFFDTGSSD